MTLKSKNKKALNAETIQHLRPLNAGDRNRTGTVSLQQDFKSCASASSATPAYILNGQRWIRTTEASCSRFTVCPLWPLGNLPILSGTIVLTRINYSILFFIVQHKFSFFCNFLTVFSYFFVFYKILAKIYFFFFFFVIHFYQI